MIRVIVNGAFGKMGKETVNAINGVDDIKVVAQIGKSDNLENSIKREKADVVVDMTTPQNVFKSVTTILKSGAHAVVGTTGLSPEQLNSIDQLAQEQNKAALVCPNFAIGAVLMMMFAKKAAEHMPHCEIIEYHHPQKLDAPSGTAIKTAKLIKEVTQEDVPMHSVRLPGIIADQDVILGGLGQSLTLKHKTISREAFMPGVLMCIRKAPELTGLTYGLENLL